MQVKFTFAGITGTASRDLSGTFVWWGGMAFQIEAAKPALRAAIEEALNKAHQAETNKNRRAQLGSLSRVARKASYKSI